MDNLQELKAKAYDLFRQKIFVEQQLAQIEQTISAMELEQKKQDEAK